MITEIFTSSFQAPFTASQAPPNPAPGSQAPCFSNQTMNAPSPEPGLHCSHFFFLHAPWILGLSPLGGGLPTGPPGHTVRHLGFIRAIALGMQGWVCGRERRGQSPPWHQQLVETEYPSPSGGETTFPDPSNFRAGKGIRPPGPSPPGSLICCKKSV